MLKNIKRKLDQKENFTTQLIIFSRLIFFKTNFWHPLKIFKPVFQPKSIICDILSLILSFIFIPKNKHKILGIPYCISVDVSTTGQNMTLDNFRWVVLHPFLFLYVVFKKIKSRDLLQGRSCWILVFLFTNYF